MTGSDEVVLGEGTVALCYHKGVRGVRAAIYSGVAYQGVTKRLVDFSPQYGQLVFRPLPEPPKPEPVKPEKPAKPRPLFGDST